jgi:hypothetical protein
MSAYAVVFEAPCPTCDRIIPWHVRTACGALNSYDPRCPVCDPPRQDVTVDPLPPVDYRPRGLQAELAVIRRAAEQAAQRRHAQ